MTHQLSRRPQDRVSSLSRRSLLKNVGVAAASAPLVLGDDDRPRAKNGKIFAYVGTYTPNGKGIHIYSMNPSNGVLTPINVFPFTTNPSWLAIDPSKKYMYVANEISNFNGGTTGSVSALAVDAATGGLTLINTVSSGGAGPAHLSVDPLGKFVFVANYGGGNVAVLPILAGGALANASDVVSDNSACSPACAVGPTQAVNGPPGSFAISGHDAPHAHMIQADAAGKYVVAQDLGLDLTIVWELNRASGTLINHQKVPSSAGAGPRHFAFHPNGRWFYSLNEEASTLVFMTYNAATGTLTPQQETTTLPPGFKGTSFTSEVIISDDGKLLYCCNRLHNSVAIFAIQASGMVRLRGEEWTRGDYPRNCNLDPTGRFLYVCHNRSDNVTTFRADGEELKFTGQYVDVGSPAVITFLEA